MTRQMTLVGFLQAQNCTNFVGSWRHPQAAPDFISRRILPPHRPRAGSRQIPSRLLRRPPGDAGPLRRRSRAHRRQRHPLREDGPDHHPDRDGHGDRTARPWLDLFHHVFRAVPCRARVRDAGPDDRGPRRLEHRDLDERRRGAEHGPRRASASTIGATTAPTSSWKSSWATGMRGTTTRSSPTARPACSRIPTRCIGWTTRANTSGRAARSPCRGPPQGHPVLIQAGQSGRGTPLRRALGGTGVRRLPRLEQAKRDYAAFKEQVAATGRDPEKVQRLRRGLSGRRGNPRRGGGQGGADRQTAEGDRQPVAAVGSAEFRLREEADRRAVHRGRDWTAGPACRACATA